MFVPQAGAVGIFPDKLGKFTILKSNAFLLLKIEQTRSPFDMSISKCKHDTTFLDSDISIVQSNEELMKRRLYGDL